MECAALLIGEGKDTSSITTETAKTPPDNRHWRKLKRCYEFNCKRGSHRACGQKNHGAEVHLPSEGGACSTAPCFLTNDQHITETASLCRKRCHKHTPPKFNETCTAWSWGSRSGSKDYKQCFLTQGHPDYQPNRQFDSGSCRGGVTLLSKLSMAMQVVRRFLQSKLLERSTCVDTSCVPQTSNGIACSLVVCD